MLKSPVLDFHLFVALLPASFIVKPFEIVSDQKLMCAQSCVHMLALGTLRRTKTGSQQHHSLSLNALDNLHPMIITKGVLEMPVQSTIQTPRV